MNKDNIINNNNINNNANRNNNMPNNNNTHKKSYSILSPTCLNLNVNNDTLKRKYSAKPGTSYQNYPNNYNNHRYKYNNSSSNLASGSSIGKHKMKLLDSRNDIDLNLLSDILSLNHKRHQREIAQKNYYNFFEKQISIRFQFIWI